MNKFFHLLTILLLFNLVTLPVAAQLGRLKNAINKSSGETSSGSTEEKEQLTDAGIPNEVHRAHLNQIVWSNEKISFTEPDASKFKTSFSALEHIYGRFYLSQSVQKSIYEMTKSKEDMLIFYYDVYVDGKLTGWVLEQGDWATPEHLQRTSQQVWVYVVQDEKTTCDVPNWSKIINTLTPGTHDVKVDLRVNRSDKVFATGSFKITKTASDVMKIGKSKSDYNVGMTDSNLSSQILTCISTFGKNNGWSESFKTVKIASSDWDIKRNNLTGVIIKRTVNAYCFATTADGLCTVQTFVFKQEYDGDKYSDVVKYDDLVGDSQRLIDCD